MLWALLVYFSQHTNRMQNIVMIYRRDIASKICDIMMKHFYCECGLLQQPSLIPKKVSLTLARVLDGNDGVLKCLVPPL